MCLLSKPYRRIPACILQDMIIAENPVTGHNPEYAGLVGMLPAIDNENC